MGKISSDFERFLYANYPDDYMRATADDVADDVITAILSRHQFHYEVWKDIPEWIRNTYRDDIPVEVLNGNTRVEDFVYDEYDKLTPEGEEEVKEEQKKEEREAMFVANLTVAFLAAGYSAEAVSRLSENHSERTCILKQMAIHGRLPEFVEAYRATRKRDRDTIANEYDKNEKCIHKKVMRLIKDLNVMERSKNGYDEEKYKEIEEKLRKTLEFVVSDEDARKRIEKSLKTPIVRASLRHLTPNVREKFSAMMEEAGLLPALQEAMQERGRKNIVRENIAEVIRSRAERTKAIADVIEQNPEKGVLRYAKTLSRMKKSQNNYDEKDYAVLEEKLKDAIAKIANSEEAKNEVVKYLQRPVSQAALYNLNEEVRAQFMSSMKDIGVLITPSDEKSKSFEINRNSLVDSLKKDFAMCEKMEKILNNKLGQSGAEFKRANVQEVVGVSKDDKIDNLVMKNMQQGNSIT